MSIISALKRGYDNKNNEIEDSNIQMITTHKETFLVKIEGKDFVNHKDGNKLNNCVANLEWVTKSENAIHSYRTGLQDNVGGRPIIRGEKLEFIRNNMSKMKDKEIALILGCARETVGVNRRKITRGEL